MRKLPTIVVAGVAATVAAAGIAVAAIPGADGSLTACYSPDQGNGIGPLRPIDSAVNCPPGDQRVTVGATGPAGPVGPAGSAGTVGERGAAGASAPAPQVFETIFSPADPVVTPGAEATPLPKSPSKAPITLALPAGTFEIDASATVYLWGYASTRSGSAIAGGPRSNSATCFLNSPGREAISAGATLGDGGNSTTISDRAVLKLDGPTTISFGCGADIVTSSTTRSGSRTVSSNYGGLVRSLRLTAVKVADGSATSSTVKSIPGVTTSKLKPSQRPGASIQSSDAIDRAQVDIDRKLSQLKGR